jgi:hypothetical protein
MLVDCYRIGKKQKKEKEEEKELDLDQYRDSKRQKIDFEPKVLFYKQFSPCKGLWGYSFFGR